MEAQSHDSGSRSGFLTFLVKADRFIEGIQTWACFILFAMILFFGGVQVFGRTVLNDAPPWTEEAMRFCGIYLTLIGSSLAIRTDAHVSVDVLINFIKDSKKRAILFTFDRIVCIVFLVMFFPASLDLVAKSSKSLGAAIRIPYSWIYAAVPLGIVMMILAYFSSIPRLAKEYAEGRR